MLVVSVRDVLRQIDEKDAPRAGVFPHIWPHCYVHLPLRNLNAGYFEGIMVMLCHWWDEQRSLLHADHPFLVRESAA